MSTQTPTFRFSAVRLIANGGLLLLFLSLTAEKCNAPDRVFCQTVTSRHYAYQNDGPVGEQTTWGDLFMLEELVLCSGICDKNGGNCTPQSKLIEVTLPNGLKQKRRINWCGCRGEDTSLSPPEECDIIRADKVDDLGAESYVDTYCEGNCPAGNCQTTRRYFFRQAKEAYQKKMLDDIKSAKTYKVALPDLVEIKILQQCECL